MKKILLIAMVFSIALSDDKDVCSVNRTYLGKFFCAGGYLFIDNKQVFNEKGFAATCKCIKRKDAEYDYYDIKTDRGYITWDLK